MLRKNFLEEFFLFTQFFVSNLLFSTISIMLHPVVVLLIFFFQISSLQNGTGTLGLSKLEIIQLANAFRSRCLNISTTNRFHPNLNKSNTSTSKNQSDSNMMDELNDGLQEGDLGLMNLMERATHSIRTSEIDDLYGQTTLHLLRQGELMFSIYFFVGIVYVILFFYFHYQC